MSPVTRRPSLLSNIVSSVIGVPHFVRTFIDSLACLYVAFSPIVGLPESDEPQYRPRGATVAIGLFLFAAMLFGIPTITLAVVRTRTLVGMAATMNTQDAIAVNDRTTAIGMRR